MSSDTSVLIAAVVRGLRAAEQAHADGRVYEVGNGWDDVAALDHEDPRVAIALRFWEGWADSAAHGWRYYEGLAAPDWPRLAAHVIDALHSDGAMSDPLLMEHFGPKPARPGLLHRVANLVGRMRRGAP